ncbi:MAG: polyprenol phosphomannose-dependent alpha 1,6 mannosyltransferase MptB [Gaiellaceae bacterium]
MVVIAVVVQLLPLLGPVLLSHDVYAYWAYGQIGAVHDGNPYSDVPATFPEDPAVRRMGTSWLETTTIYGPVWALVAEGVSETADSARAATYAFRAIAAASMLAIVALVALIARNRPFAVAFVGWNPLLALHFAGGGHNDALMMALALGALTFGLRRRPGAAGLAWIASLAVKWVAAAFAGLVLLGGRYRERRLLAGMVAGGMAIAVTAFSLFGSAWLDAGSGLSTQARRTGSIGLSGWLGDLGLGHRPTLAVIAVATLVVAAWLAWQAWRGRVRLGLAGVLLAALQGWLNPWYAVWGVSLAAPEEDTAAHIGAMLLTGLLLRDALPL